MKVFHGVTAWYGTGVAVEVEHGGGGGYAHGGGRENDEYRINSAIH